VKITPRDYQRIGLDAIIGELRERVSTIVDMATGTGKSLADSEPVLTPAGWVPIGAVRVGDYVVGRDGMPTRVRGVYPQGSLDVYRLMFDDGTYSRCSADHLWAVQTRDDKNHGRPLKVLTTAQISESISRGWYVPVSLPWEGQEKSLPLDPYLLGVLLGDGGVTQNVMVSTADVEILNRVKEAVRFVSPNLSVKHVANYDYRISTQWGKHYSNPIRDTLAALGLRVKSRAKFVPRMYLESSRSQRLEMLRGLMDTDGCCGKSGPAEFAVTSRQLAEDVAELVRSLGGVTRVREKSGVYRVTVNTTDNPFHLERKALRYRFPSRSHTKKIVSVTHDGCESCTCIKVAAPDSLFVTRSFIVTHNTYFFAWLCMLLGGRVLVVVHKDELKRQAIEKILRICPDMAITIEQGESRGDRRGERNLFEDTGSPVVIASKDTLSRPSRLRRYKADDFDYVIVDEAHRAVKKNESYQAIFRHFCRAPIGRGTAQLIGVSASLDRLDGEALGGTFQSVAYRYLISQAIDDGYLLDVKTKRALIKGVTLTAQPTKRNPDGELDITQSALDRVMRTREYAYGIAKPLLEISGDTKKAAIFTTGHTAAETQVNVLNAEKRGSAVLCLGEPYQSIEERREAQGRFRYGDCQYIVTCDVLTEGWDDDGCEIVVVKPSKSRQRVAQMVGRGTRPLDGCVDVWRTAADRRLAIANSPKPHCIVLDPCGASEAHSLVNVTDIFCGRYSSELSKAKLPPKPSKPPKDIDERRAMRNALAILEEERLEGLAVQVDYELLDADMMGDPSRKAGAVSKSLLVTPATERQCRWLESHGFTVPAGLTRNQASNTIGQIRARDDAGIATPAQKSLLARLGLPTLVTKGEARALLDRTLNPAGEAEHETE
jgi:superfamily II DNA or RNA helicase